MVNRRCFNVLTRNRRWIDVALTWCACWACLKWAFFLPIYLYYSGENKTMLLWVMGPITDTDNQASTFWNRLKREPSLSLRTDSHNKKGSKPLSVALGGPCPVTVTFPWHFCIYIIDSAGWRVRSHLLASYSSTRRLIQFCTVCKNTGT